MAKYYLQHDFRSEMLLEILDSLSRGFSRIQNKYDINEWFDAHWAQEQAESIYGIAYVTAQTYITGTISDVIKSTKPDKRLSKISYMSIGCDKVSEGISTITFVDALANYYKHYEEWQNWEVTQYNKQTISNLRKGGITKNCEFPCWEAASILSDTGFLSEFAFLRDILINWRTKLIEELNSKN